MSAPEHICVEALNDHDVHADLAALLTGARDVDGITVDDAEGERGRLTVTFVDAAGHQRSATLTVVALEVVAV